MCTILFLATTFRYGWVRRTSDFPNYYTAAVLVRQGQPLHKYYDWTWFEYQMNYAGFEQVGAYLPQSPLAMLPLIGIAGLQAQTAKRIWLAVNFAFLVATFWLSSRVTRFRIDQIAILAFLGFGTLHFNFLYGQYYVFILFLLTLAFYFLQKSKPGYSGLLFGAAFALKLYGGPFLLYLGAKRHWRALTALIAASLCLSLTAIAIFGWKDIAYFGTQILPRSVEGETLDPYSSLNGTLSTLLRRAFVMEPELNPYPLWNAPRLFFFLRPFLTLAILTVPLLALWRSTNQKRGFAWFFIAVMLASPNTGSYTFILLLLPVLLLLDEAKLPRQIFLLTAIYILLSIPPGPTWSFLFPKVWLLLALFLYAGRDYWRLVRMKTATAATAAITLIAALSAIRHAASFSKEPGQRWERIAVQRGALFSSSPTVLHSGIVYQAIGKSRYVLRQFHEGRFEEFAFSGEAVHPVAQSPNGPIRFELLEHRSSTMMLFDPVRKTLTRERLAGSIDTPSLAVSPDGNWVAFTLATGGNQQVWLRHSGSTAMRITGGNCNSSSPVWELDSKAVIFESDCGRGIGWTALYRAQLDQIARSN